jgi:N utilization substance protein B
MSNDKNKNEKSKKPAHHNAIKFAARLAAVQVVYQSLHNDQNLIEILDEFISHRRVVEIEGAVDIKPDGALLKKIIETVAARKADLESMITANIKPDARAMELVLKAILLCAAAEIVMQNADTPVIINEYLNAAHAFFGPNEAALVNGILDSMANGAII